MAKAPFVGRAEELEELGRLARTAADGRATTAVISGPAGIGKTALLTALGVESSAFRLVRLSGDETEQYLPYSTLGGLLGRDPPEWASPFSAGADALRSFGALCECGPVICAVDDAHLCDAQSLTALNFMIRRMRSDPLLLVLAVRPEGIAQLPPTLASQAGHRMTLTGVSVAAVRDLSEALGRPRLSWHAASRVQAHTSGNPLHLRTLLEEVPVDVLEDLTCPIPAPESLAQLVVAELSRLSSNARGVAAAASVLGERPAIDTMVEVAEVTLLQCRDACEELARAGILRVAAASAYCEFAHPVMRSAVHDDLGPATRATLHLRAARLSRGADALEHRVHAAFGPDPALAADLERDAQVNIGAGRLLRAARAMLQSARLSSQGADADRRLLGGIEALLLAGDVSAAQAQASALEALPRSGRRLAVEARIAWLSGDATRAIRLGHEAWAVGEDLSAEELDALAALLAQIEMLRDNWDEVEGWAARALKHGRLDPAATPQIRSMRCVAVGVQGRAREGLRLLETLPVNPEEVPPRQHPELAARGMLRMLTGELSSAEADLAVSGSLDHSDLAPFRLTASAARAETLFRLGQWDGGQQTVQHSLDLADDMGQVWLTGYIHAVAALVPSARGDWRRAQDHVDAARRVAAHLGDRATGAYAADAAVHLASHRGDPEAVIVAARPLRQLPITAPPLQPGMMNWPTHLVTALVELGRIDEARAELETHERLARAQEHRPSIFSTTWLSGVIAAARRDTGRARSAFDRSLEMCDDDIDSLGHILVRYHYGRFLRRRGERRRAVNLLHEARAHAAGLCAAPLVRRCEEELGACGGPTVGPAGPTTPTLTPQEHVIASLVCAGDSNRQVAEKLVLSPKTVSYHLTNVYAKLGVHSRVQLTQALNKQP